MCARVYVHVCTCVFEHVRVCERVYAFMCLCLSMCVHAYVFVCAHLCVLCVHMLVHNGKQWSTLV